MGSTIIDKDLGWKQIKKQLSILNEMEVASGLFGTESPNPETNVAYRGIINEVGHDNTPARPFTRQAFDSNKNATNKFTDIQYNKVLAGTSTTVKMLNRLGVYTSDQIKRTITTGNFAPNSPVTIAIKGSTSPLINTGEMRQAENYKIRKR